MFEIITSNNCTIGGFYFVAQIEHALWRLAFVVSVRPHWNEITKKMRISSLSSNDWKGCSLESTVLHLVPNSSKIRRFTTVQAVAKLDMLHLRRLLSCYCNAIVLALKNITLKTTEIFHQENVSYFSARPIVAKRFWGFTKMFHSVFCSAFYAFLKNIVVFQIAAQYFLKGTYAKKYLEKTGFCQ